MRKGVLESIEKWRQNKTEIVLGECRPIATLEKSGEGGIRVL